MQFYGALILLVTFSAACGLRCYSCTQVLPKFCTGIISCGANSSLCYSKEYGLIGVLSVVTKGCYDSNCCGFVSYCEGDLCNSGVAAGPSVVLLLVASALLTPFI